MPQVMGERTLGKASGADSHSPLPYKGDLEIRRPVFGFVKGVSVHVLAAVKQHAIVDIDEIVIYIRSSFREAE